MPSPDTKNATEYLRIGAVAERLGIHVDTVRAWCERGDLAFIRTPGNQRRILAASVDALLERSTPDAETAA